MESIKCMLWAIWFIPCFIALLIIQVPSSGIVLALYLVVFGLSVIMVIASALFYKRD